MVVIGWYLHSTSTILFWQLRQESKNRKSTRRNGPKVPMLFFPILVSTAVAASQAMRAEPPQVGHWEHPRVKPKLVNKEG